MSIFGKLILEETVQVDDKTRLKAIDSYVSKDEAAITLVRIKPEASGDYIDVTGSSSRDWYLDWEYSTDGTKTVTVEITTDGLPQEFTKNLTVITEADDKLFSSDSDLVNHESDIKKYLPDGKQSYKYLHRRAQERILNYLNDHGVLDTSGDRLTKDDILQVTDFKDWSIFLTLQYIFDGLSNSSEDVFFEKARFYERKTSMIARGLNQLRIDRNNDGNLTISDYSNNRSGRLVRG